MGTKLDTTTNIGLLLASIVVIGFVVLQYVSPPRGYQRFVDNGYQPDDVVRLAGVSFNGVDETVLLQLSTTCRFCDESMSFYRDLVERKAQSRRNVQFVAVGREPAGVLRDHLARNGVHIEQVVTADSTFRGFATPTLILADRTGKVQKVWRGLLSRPKESELIRAVYGDRQDTVSQ